MMLCTYLNVNKQYLYMLYYIVMFQTNQYNHKMLYKLNLRHIMCIALLLYCHMYCLHCMNYCKFFQSLIKIYQLSISYISLYYYYLSCMYHSLIQRQCIFNSNDYHHYIHLIHNLLHIYFYLSSIYFNYHLHSNHLRSLYHQILYNNQQCILNNLTRRHIMCNIALLWSISSIV